MAEEEAAVVVGPGDPSDARERIVKADAEHASSVLTQVIRTRSAVAASSRPGASVANRAAPEAVLERSLVNVLVLAEAYPQLRASELFTQLQSQPAGTEDQLAFTRQYDNDAVTKLNSDVLTIPWMPFAGLAGDQVAGIVRTATAGRIASRHPSTAQ